MSLKRSEAEIQSERRHACRVLVAQAEALEEAFQQACAYDQLLLSELRHVTGQQHTGGLLAGLTPDSPWDRDSGLPELVRRLRSLRNEGRAP